MAIDRISISNVPAVIRTARMSMIDVPYGLTGRINMRAGLGEEEIGRRIGTGAFSCLKREGVILIDGGSAKISLDVLKQKLDPSDDGQQNITLLKELYYGGLLLRGDEKYSFVNIAGALHRIADEDVLISRYGSLHDKIKSAIEALMGGHIAEWNRIISGIKSGQKEPLVIDFTGAILKGVDLQHADLRWSDLRKTNLSGADLRGTCIRATNSLKARYAESSLQGKTEVKTERSICFDGADLSGADLHGANLMRARVLGAKFEGTKFSPVNIFWGLVESMLS